MNSHLPWNFYLKFYYDGNNRLRKETHELTKTEAATSWRQDFIEFSCHESVKINYVTWMFMYQNILQQTEKRVS